MVDMGVLSKQYVAKSGPTSSVVVEVQPYKIESGPFTGNSVWVNTYSPV